MNAQVHADFLNKTKEKRDDLQKVQDIREAGAEHVADYLLNLDRLEEALNAYATKAKDLRDIDVTLRKGKQITEKENGSDAHHRSTSHLYRTFSSWLQRRLQGVLVKRTKVEFCRCVLCWQKQSLERPD